MIILGNFGDEVNVIMGNNCDYLNKIMGKCIDMKQGKKGEGSIYSGDPSQRQGLVSLFSVDFFLQIPLAAGEKQEIGGYHQGGNEQLLQVVFQVRTFALKDVAGEVHCSAQHGCDEKKPQGEEGWCRGDECVGYPAKQ